LLLETLYIAMTGLRVALLLLGLCPIALGQDVVALTTLSFEQFVKDNRQTLVEFYAPWCGHCKKLAPEYEKAASKLKTSGVQLAKVDATEEKDLASKYNVKGFPTLMWFEDAKQVDYDGGRTADTIIEWVTSMTGPAVLESTPTGPVGMKPQIVLTGTSMLPGFEEAAKAHRRKASWYFNKDNGYAKAVLTHRSEEPIELTGSDAGNKEKIVAFLNENLLPLFGPLDGDTFDRYMEAGKGMVWSLFPGEDINVVEVNNRPMMTKVAKQFKGRYYMTFTDTIKFKEAVDNMLSIEKFPAIAVQKKAGDKKKYIYDGEMSEIKITQFIQDVDAGRAQPKLKSEAEPKGNTDSVKQIVGTTIRRDVFTADKDVLLQVYAPWCGHCKKLDPEWTKLAKKIEKEELTDLLAVGKIDGTANDSPVDTMDWTGFPTIYMVKAGIEEPVVYEGERTAKGLWKYIKKHATKAVEIRERVERNKKKHNRDEEL